MRLLLLLSILLTFPVSAKAYKKKFKRCRHTSKKFACVLYVRNYDGDTITFNINKVHPLIGENISVRVRGIDTPEIRGKTECEKKVAIIARDTLEAFLKDSHRVDLIQPGRDKYFRILADVRVDGQMVSNFLISRKLAYPYFGGTKPEYDWCQNLSEIQKQYNTLKLKP